MADDYIDDQEVSEYGEFFYEESAKLEGLSPIFNMKELRAVIRDGIDKFQAERKKLTEGKSELSSSQKDTKTAAEEARDVLTRFYSFLGSFKKGTIDLSAFFPKGKLGELAPMKPADLKTKLETVALGFEAEKNKSFSQRDQWRKEIGDALFTLEGALDKKEGKRTDSQRDTNAKTVAYENFLTLYNGVAKHTVQGLLHLLGRVDEYKLFFKDLQVLESTQNKKAQKEAAKKASDTKKSKKANHHE